MPPVSLFFVRFETYALLFGARLVGDVLKVRLGLLSQEVEHWVHLLLRVRGRWALCLLAPAACHTAGESVSLVNVFSSVDRYRQLRIVVQLTLALCNHALDDLLALLNLLIVLRLHLLHLLLLLHLL